MTSVASEIDAQTRLGEVYITSLMRSQLRLAVGVLLALGLTLGAAAAALPPRAGHRADSTCSASRCRGCCSTVVASTEIIALGWLYVRQAERNEEDFSDLLEGR